MVSSALGIPTLLVHPKENHLASSLFSNVLLHRSRSSAALADRVGARPFISCLSFALTCDKRADINTFLKSSKMAHFVFTRFVFM
jgi:hypothetical protein